MFNLIIPRARFQQPQYVCTIRKDYSNYFIGRNGYVYTPYLGLTRFNDRNGTIAAYTNRLVGSVVSRGGIATTQQNGDAVDGIIPPIPITAIAPDALVWLVVARKNSNSYQGLLWHAGDNMGTVRCSCSVSPNNLTAGWSARNGMGGAGTLGSATFVLPASESSVRVVAMRYSYSKDQTECWVDGVSISPTTYVRSGGATSSMTFESIFGNIDYNRAPDILLYAMSNVDIPSAMLKNLSINPWELFSEIKPQYFFLQPPSTVKFRRTLSSLGAGIGKRQLIGA
jgi:hypothetical protein